MPTSLTVDVALTPELLPPAHSPDGSVYVVIDVIRATTMLCALFEKGAARVFVAPGIAEARAAREQLGAEYLLAGEVAGARPDGFDLGNSPSELASHDVRGRQIIFATTNGTRALHACRAGRAVFIGALRNADAVVTAALSISDAATALTSTATFAPPSTVASEARLAEAAPGIIFACSGRGGLPAFDDTLCAGYLVSALLAAADENGRGAELAEGARIALSVWNDVARTSDLRAALASSDAGRSIASIGLSADLEWCATRDATTIVPLLSGVLNDGATDLLVAEPMSDSRTLRPFAPEG